MVLTIHQHRPDNVGPYLLVVSRVLPFVLISMLGAVGFGDWLGTLPVA